MNSNAWALLGDWMARSSTHRTFSLEELLPKLTEDELVDAMALFELVTVEHAAEGVSAGPAEIYFGEINEALNLEYRTRRFDEVHGGTPPPV